MTSDVLWIFVISPYFYTPILAFFLAQLTKTAIFCIHDRKIKLKYFLTDGGMPSAHAAVMSSLTVALLLYEGLVPLFYVSFFVTMIVVRDAYGVRLQTGKQAHMLNEIVRRMHLPHHKALKELVGHTKSQAFLGMVLGITVAIVGYMIAH